MSVRVFYRPWLTEETNTDSLPTAMALIKADPAHAVLPESACGREIDSGRVWFTPLTEPTPRQELGRGRDRAARSPREFTVQVGDTLREETARLIRSGRWPATSLSQEAWDPDRG